MAIKCQLFFLSLTGIAIAYLIYLKDNLSDYPTQLLQINSENIQENKTYSILMPIPTEGYDPTEAAVPWKYFSQQDNFKIVFSTYEGTPSKGADPQLLSNNLNSMAFGPPSDVKQKYEEMIASESYQNPIKWAHINASEFDAIFIVGGHNPGMKEMLESQLLQKKLLNFKKENKTIGSICHGSLLLVNTEDLFDRPTKLTSVPSYLESMAHYITKYVFQMNDYQLSTTYNLYTQDTVQNKKNVVYDQGPVDYLAALMPTEEGFYRHGYLSEDGQFLSARFWGDAYLFAKRFVVKIIDEQNN